MKSLSKFFLTFTIIVSLSLTVESQTYSADEYKHKTNNWSLKNSGEDLIICEPEDANKVWAKFKDDDKLELLGTGNLMLHFNKWVYINSKSEANNRFGFVHTGKHAYVDFKDNLHFRADKNYISPLILQGDGNVAIGFGTTYATDGTQYQTKGYKLGINGDVHVENGWLRVAGSRGLYFESHGGGFYMTDNTWIRTYNNKSFYHNSGIMRTDGNFQVGGNGSRFVVNTSGNVGINNVSPSYKLDVNGTIRANDFTSAGGKNIIVGDDAYLSDVDRANILGVYGMTNNDRAGIQLGSNTGSYIYGVGGNIGIGTRNTQGYKLAVNGKIVSEGVKCITDVPNSDYVFENDYNLMKLDDVEQFVKQNKHLPEVPSAQEFKENGYNMGQFDDLMLRKVEELTLYIIEQNKKIEELQKQLNTIQQ